MDSSDFYTNLLHTFVARNERWHVPKEFESKGLDFPKDCANTEGSYIHYSGIRFKKKLHCQNKNLHCHITKFSLT